MLTDMFIGPFSCMLHSVRNCPTHILYAPLTSQSRRGPAAPTTSHVEDGTFFIKFPIYLSPMAPDLSSDHHCCVTPYAHSAGPSVASQFDHPVISGVAKLTIVYTVFISDSHIQIPSSTWEKLFQQLSALSLQVLNVLLTTSSVTFGNPVKIPSGPSKFPSFQRAFDWFHFTILSLSWPQSIKRLKVVIPAQH